MTPGDAPCKARGRGCGSPGGWRRGGRCPRCRAAHNEDTSRRHWERVRPDDETLAKLRALLRAGVDGPVAAREAEVHPATVNALLRREPDLRAESVVPTEPPSDQAKRQNTYLVQLLDHRGIPEDAVGAAQVGWSTLQHWRTASAEFRAADDALRALARAQGEKSKSRAKQRKPIDEDRLRQLWASQLAVIQVAKFFDVSSPTVHARAAELGLGPRPKWAQETKDREHRRSQLRTLWLSGMSTRDIALRLGISEQAVSSGVRRAGLPRRGPRGRVVGEGTGDRNDENAPTQP